MKKPPLTAQILTKDGKPYPISPEGSLGLLALGYTGLRAWREARQKQLEKVKRISGDK